METNRDKANDKVTREELKDEICWTDSEEEAFSDFAKDALRHSTPIVTPSKVALRKAGYFVLAFHLLPHAFQLIEAIITPWLLCIN